MRVNEVFDFLFELAMSSNVTDEQIQVLCTLLGVSFQDLQKHSLKVATSS